MRMINADDLEQALREAGLGEIIKTDCSKCTSAWGVPIVDAEPVKHGHWKSSQGLAETGEVQCSNCKTIYYADDLYNVGETDENGIGQALMPNYCPHCGAKMDEVEK